MRDSGSNLELFPRKDEFRIVALTNRDVQRKTDNLLQFKEIVLESEPMYQGIDQWLYRRVLPALGTPHRLALLGYESDRPAVSAVLKVGTKSKFCHVRVKDRHHDKHLGELFFT